MNTNMGILDRIIRLTVAATIAVLYYTNTIIGVPAIMLLVLAGILVLTSLASFCPLYKLMDFNTCSAKKQ